MDDERKILKEGSVRNRVEDISRVFGKHSGMKVCIEASTKTFWMADQLSELGLEPIPVDPGKTKAIGSGLIKNDKLDARVLATLCQANVVARVDHPDAETRHARMVVVSRDGVVRSRSRLMTLVRSLLDSEGYELRHLTAKSFPEAVRGMFSELPEMIQTALTPLLDAIEAMNEQVAVCDKIINERTKGDKVAQLLCTVPGVGPIVASTFISAIRDPKRFDSGRSVGAYLGLVPSLYESGTIHRKGRVTKHGNRQARWALTMAASVMLGVSKQHSSLREWGLRISKKHGRKKAVVAVARKLAGVLWAMWRDERAFRYSGTSMKVAA